eukprot:403343519
MRKKLSQIKNIKKISTTPLQYSKQPSFIINDRQESLEINLAENQEYEIKLNKSERDEREQLDRRKVLLTIPNSKQFISQYQPNVTQNITFFKPIPLTQQHLKHHYKIFSYLSVNTMKKNSYKRSQRHFNEEKLRKRYDQLQTTEIQKVQFFVKYDKNEINFQEKYLRYLSKTQLKNPKLPNLEKFSKNLTTKLQKFIRINRQQDPHIQESSEVTTQKKLVIIQKKIQRYRKKRYHEFAKLENDNPKADQKAEFYIEKYFESPEVQKQNKLEKQLVKIPEVSHRVGYQSVQNSSQQLPIQDIRKHLNNSTFILKQKEKDLSKDQSRSASPQKPQNPFVPLSLHDKFLDHIEKKKVINTFKEETLYEDIKGLWVKSNKFKQQKTQFRDKVKELICKKRVTISAFDHKNKFKEGNSQRDHLKENTFKVIGEKQCVENIIKQNFQPLLQLNLPQLEQQTGFSRKDLFNLYTHFLSILRIQQTERQHLKCGKVSQLTGIDFDIFRDNVPVIKYENKEVADKILSQIKAEVRDDQIQWADFLKYLKMILAKSFSEKIDIFFYAFDVDKNRMFSWDEVKAICTSCLGQMFSSQDEFVESLSLYFTKYIFEAVGFEKGQEIPVDEIKHAIRTASGEEGDLLKMFVGADGFNQQQQQENHGSGFTL